MHLSRLYRRVRKARPVVDTGPEAGKKKDTPVIKIIYAKNIDVADKESTL